MRQRTLGVMAAGVLVAMAGRSPAQTADGTSVDLKGFTSRAMERLALLDLRATQPTLQESYAIADALLSVASDLSPNDADLVRRRLEAAWASGDTARVLTLTRRIVELDPTDTVAQLRLITARIGRLQTVEERLGAYESFLGPRGAGLDASIRSRLAVDAALLMRERGNDEGFVRFLKQAVALDGTNKDAALLAFSYFSARVNDVQGRVEMLGNVLYADPLDPRTHRLLRDEFASHGAYAAAKRFHGTEFALSTLADNPEPDGHTRETFLLEWMVDGPRGPMEGLDLQLQSRRAEVRTAADRDPTKVSEGAGFQNAQEVRLDLEYEQVRALTAFAAGDDELLAASMKDLTATVSSRVAALGDVTRRPLGMSPEQAAERIVDVVLEMHLLRTLVGQEIAEDRAKFEEAISSLDATDPRRADSELWKLLESGDHAGALALAKANKTPTLWTNLGQARALELGGDAAGSVKLLLACASEYPVHILGAYAYWKAQKLGGDPAQAKLAADLEAYARTIPDWIDQMISTPSQTQSLWVDLEQDDAGAMDPVRAVVRLKNVASVPLGLGSGRTLNSRLFFGPTLEIGVRSRSDNASGEVFDVDRRLRLMPDEEMTITLWPEVGLTGWLSEVGSLNASRLRWRVFQGFETSSTGEKHIGPGCLDAVTGTLARKPLEESRLSTAKLIARIGAAKDDQVPALLVAVRTRLMGGVPGGTPDPDAAAIAGAVEKAYAGWSPTARLAAVAVLPPATVVEALAGVDAAVRADTDGSVRLAALATRAAKADDPWLVECTSSPDARVARLAGLQTARVRVALRTYASQGVQAVPRTTANDVPAGGK